MLVMCYFLLLWVRGLPRVSFGAVVSKKGVNVVEGGERASDGDCERFGSVLRCCTCSFGCLLINTKRLEFSSI